MQPYLKYWPSLLGVFTLALLGTLLWPKEEPARTVVAPSFAEAEDEIQREERPDFADEVEQEARPSAPKGRIVVLETQIPVVVPGEEIPALSADDSDVQEALSAVEIEIYKADWCSNCRNAVRFFEQNNIEFVSHDVESDWSLKDKARRLSGQTGIPVIVIDGAVTVGFSSDLLSQRLSSAVERRVVASRH